MLVKEFIEKFRWFNPNARLTISNHGYPVPFEINYGGPDGCDTHNCEFVTIDINPPANELMDSDLIPVEDILIDDDAPSFLRKGK